MKPVVFVLGPSRWRDPLDPWDEEIDPMESRYAIHFVLDDLGIESIVMEDEPGPVEESWLDKFFRLLDERSVTHILFYWPPESRIDSAEDELVMIAVRQRFASIKHLQLILFGHPDAVRDEQSGDGRFLNVRDDAGRSSYLGQIPRQLPTDLHEWDTHGELLRQVQEWAKAMFPHVIDDERLEQDLTPLHEILPQLKKTKTSA